MPLPDPRPAGPATAPGSAAEYDTAAALAVTAERLADAVDDNRPDWLPIACDTGALLADLVADRLGVPLALAADAAELSATAADLSADLATGRYSPVHIARARHLLDALASALDITHDATPAA